MNFLMSDTYLKKYFAYVLTNKKGKILASSNSVNLIIDSKEITKTSVIQDLLPNLNNIKEDTFIKTNSINNSILHVKKTTLSFDSDLFCLYFIFNFSINEEIFKQLDLLSEQNHLYLEMFNKLQDGIFITDETGKTVYVNDSFLYLSGLERKTLIGETVFKLMAQNIVPNSCCAKVIESGKAISTINNYYGGRKCLVSGSPIFDSNGILKNTIAVIRDVSELESLMEKLANEKSLIMTYKHEIKKITKREQYKELTITRSKSMEEVFEQANKVADFDSTILIHGETGVGKDFLANYIHNISGYSDSGNFVKINCAAIPDNLLESELFGYEKGAFSGAHRQGKIGLFEKANNGTLFLDEIGEMPLKLQSKLLNALNDREFIKLGGNTPIKFDARIISATNADLHELINNKKFRLDLYYRLNVINIKIPPLRDRKEDILPLAMIFLEYYNNKYKRICYFSPDSLEMFLLYTWPGNIRELKNTVERLVLITNKDCIESQLFQNHIIKDNHISKFEIPDINKSNVGLTEKLNSYEKHLIEKEIMSTKTLEEAALNLKIDLSTLVRKKRKYGIYKRK